MMSKREEKHCRTGNPKELKLFDLIETDFDSDVENYLHKKLYMYYSKEGDSKEFYIIGEDELKDGIKDAREYEKNIIPIKLEAKENNLLESNGNYLEHDEDILSLTKELYEIKGQLNWLKVKNEILNLN